MDLVASGFQHNFSISPGELLINDEILVLVDDDPMIREPIRIYFEEHGLKVVEADNGKRFQEILAASNVALALLDIGLPDIDGKTILPQIKINYPNVVIIMLSGISDLQTALECIRQGADDYLAKPVRLNEILLAVKKNLEKRRLVLQNRQYQEELEKANFRIQFMHQLSLKMNSVYFNTVELDETLQAILVGITANEGLRFNRAFLALVDEKEGALVGKLAIGPGCHEEAVEIWGELKRKEMNFFEIVKEVKSRGSQMDLSEINKLVKGLRVPLTESGNILIRSMADKKSIKVVMGQATGFDLSALVGFFGCDNFVVVPLYSPSRSLGVIIADNFITKQHISDGHVGALELFSSQASLAIEHSRLYADMQKTIGDLEEVNYELDKNKDMLIESERYSVLGHMAAQMVHNIRNPVTAIGGISRILAKKCAGQNLEKYSEVMGKETVKLESILSDLFEFVSQTNIERTLCPLYPLLQKALLLLQSEIKKQGIVVEVNISDPELQIEIDNKLIRKMLVHLFKNAIEAMPDGGRLSVRVVREENWLSIRITNTGKSIEEEQISRAKEPFFTTKSYGTGMGLTMVDRILTAHQGNFLISRRENGTEVLVNLPIGQ